MRAVGRSRSEVELGSDLARLCLVPDRVGACRVVRESDIDAPPLSRPQRPASPRVVRLQIGTCYVEITFAADLPRPLDRMRLGAGSSRTNSLTPPTPDQNSCRTRHSMLMRSLDRTCRSAWPGFGPRPFHWIKWIAGNCGPLIS